MKTFSTFLALALIASSVHAATKKPVYSREGTEGEYPSAYDVVLDVTIHGARVPGGARDVECTLEKGTKIYFAQLPSYTFTYQVGKYQALKSLTIEETLYEEGKTPLKVNVKKGDIVKVITYYAEGFNRAKFKDATEMDLEYFQVMGSKDFKEIQTLEQETWVEVKCLDAHAVWINDVYLRWYPKSVKPGFFNPYDVR